MRGVLFRAIKAYARYVENSFPWTGIEALAGEDIEGSAHELYVIVPYEKRKQIDRVDQFLVDAFFEVARNFSSLLVQATEKMGYCVEGEERATNRKPKYIITNTPGERFSHCEWRPKQPVFPCCPWECGYFQGGFRSSH